MKNEKSVEADSTAVRVALWRAMHSQIDSKPSVHHDELGLKLAAPDENWRSRPDMHPEGTKGYRAAIVGRARFIEDFVQEKLQQGNQQYVILGAGLDTFVQRYPQIAEKMTIFEIDKPSASAWKQKRLIELGLGIPEHLKLVPVDFESNESWLKKIIANGFAAGQPAVVASAGVAMYLTKDAIKAMLKEISGFAPGSSLVMSFLLPLELIDAEDRAAHQAVYEKARAAGTPFLSFFSPTEAIALAKEAGFKNAKHVSRADLIQKYFSGRADGLKPASGEEILIAET